MAAWDVGRFERKYVVSEGVATAVRRFVAAYLPLDDHMDPAEPLGYRVHSLYLDTADLDLYRQTARGLKNRYKLRIRFYDGADAAPAFLEIKRRDGDTIHKQRAIVSKQAAERLLAGGRILPADMISRSEEAHRALADFCERRDRLAAGGIVFVSYWREAFVSRQAEAARVTFDRDVVGHNYSPSLGLKFSGGPSQAVSDKVVLELKYTGDSPAWMRDLIKTFALQRISFPKYLLCADALKLAPAMAG